jgi:hypothetical protein
MYTSEQHKESALKSLCDREIIAGNDWYDVNTRSEELPRAWLFLLTW